MRPMIIIAAVGAIAGCPYDETAADITAGDGGIWIGDPNDGGFLFPQTDGGAVYIAKAPSLNTLCKLVVGDYGPVQDMNAPRFLGTWIGDVESSLFFGPPAPNSEQLGKDNAQLSYHWPNGGIFLSFRWVQAWSGRGAGWANTAWPKSFFLEEISIDGDPTYPDCWRGELGYPGQVPCPECQGSNDKLWECQPYPCDSKDIREGK